MGQPFDLALWEDEVERRSPIFGEPLRIVELTEGARVPDEAPGVLVGVDRQGRLPRGLDGFDLLLTTAAAPPRPWVGLAADRLDESLAMLVAAVSRNPVAAAALVQVLRIGPGLAFDDALVLESAVYSTLLGGEEFRGWRRARPVRCVRDDSAPRVSLHASATGATITLTRPGHRNAVDARLRDELVEALRATAADPGVTAVVLTGRGPDFCAGGDLDEFGRAGDLAVAHFTRVMRSPARLIHRQADLMTVRIQGACIGAGLEMAAAAGRVTAARDAWFRLPEVAMGLIPGAGGTVTVARRIGRRRTAWLALAGVDLDAQTALDWGLVDALGTVG